jgi:hypothetical protein
MQNVGTGVHTVDICFDLFLYHYSSCNCKESTAARFQTKSAVDLCLRPFIDRICKVFPVVEHVGTLDEVYNIL